MRNNVFTVGTEYHLLVAISIINEQFMDYTLYRNKIIFMIGDNKNRKSDYDYERLPNYVHDYAFISFNEKKSELIGKLFNTILNEPIHNLFVVHAYRPLDTLIIHKTLRKYSSRIHMMQDGALFYNNFKRIMWLGNLNIIYKIYRDLANKRILFFEPLFFAKFMMRSNYIDELWMTHPELYVDSKSFKSKKINKFTLFPSKQSVEDTINSIKEPIPETKNALIYISTIMRTPEHVNQEIDLIKNVQKKHRLDSIVVKVHPGSSEFQKKMLYKVFGEAVILNYVPAELYILKAANCVIVGCNSTSLFYYNPSCKYYSLRKIFHDIGIYAKWKIVNLPDYVTLYELDELI